MDNAIYTKTNDLKTDEKYKFSEYRIFNGVTVVYNDIHVDKISNNFKQDFNSNTYEINHCREGRFECVLKDGSITYMEAGDFAINPLKNISIQSEFPISHYHGVTIYITPCELGEEVHFLEKIFEINFHEILNKLCYGDKLFIKRATPEIQHIFYEIYHVPEDIVIPYLKVKIQELFLYLSTIDSKARYSDRGYFTKSNVDIVKSIHSFVVENSSEHYTYKELSSMFSIKQTTMKKCYKSVYGQTIFDTIKKKRLQKAAILLKDTSSSVTEIALEIGYSNHANFSKAFKQMHNLAPSEYRKILSD